MSIGDHCLGLDLNQEQALNRSSFSCDVIVSDLAESILGRPNVTEISYQNCYKNYTKFFFSLKLVQVLFYN